MNNTDGHYQDNRAEYFFGHIDELTRIGVVGLPFGAGNAGSTQHYDDRADGRTNPASFCATDGVSSGQVCNTHQSTVTDDNGGYLRMAAAQYYAGLSSSPSPSPSAWPSPGTSSAPATYALALSATAGGSATATPASARYAAGATVTLAATPNAGFVFTGWEVDGVTSGWASPTPLTIGADRTVVAHFAPIPALRDLPSDPASASAVQQLAARGIIKGCVQQAGLFCPDKPILRAQMAALIVRAMGWPPANGPVRFSDRGPVDDELWQAVGSLAARQVGQGYADGTYDPTGPVLHVQTIAFITRAMVEQGWWEAQPDNPALYPTIPASSGHREDIATWVRYAGPVPGMNTTAGDWSAWSTPAERSWFALALWTAFDQHAQTERLP